MADYREQIQNLVEARPGICLKQIQEALGLNRDQMTKSLGALKKLGQLHWVKDSNGVRYYPGEDFGECMREKRHPSTLPLRQRQIFAYIQRAQPVYRRQILDATGFYHSTVAYSLDQLQLLGLISAVHENGKTYYQEVK